jgi:hypothetical protein
MSQVKNATAVRPINVIANEIRTSWGSKVYFGAKPYLEAMRTLNDMSDSYGSDSAKSIIIYFLANASTFRGEDARRIKLELNKMVK